MQPGISGRNKHMLSILHCMKSVGIRSYSGLYFSALGLNTERYSALLRIQSKSGKMQTRITPNMDTFYGVLASIKASCFFFFPV